MVCMRVTFHENEGTKTTKTTKTTQTATNEELRAGLANITETTDVTKPQELGVQITGSQTTGLEIPRKKEKQNKPCHP